MNGLALCSGIGGLDLGLHIALDGYRTICYVEREAFCASALVARMEDKALDCAPVWDDLATFDGDPWRGVVDIISAGYPCQPFSVAGRRAGTDDPRHLWPHVARIIGECEPGLVFLENVPNHLRIGFDIVAGDLQRMGYAVAATLHTAAEVGAPHRRERLFVLAHHVRRRRDRLDKGKAVKGGDGPQDGVPESDSGPLALPASPRRTPRERGAGGPVRDEARRAEPDGRRAGGPGRLGRGRFDDADGNVVNASGARLERREVGAIDASRHPFAWPPGPGDFDGWREALERWPELAPALDDTQVRSMRVNCDDNREAVRQGNAPPVASEDGLEAVAESTRRENRQAGVSSPERDGQGEEVEPAVRGVADGPASRVDRLRALGNAVVPVQAAVAFVDLLRGLGVIDGDEMPLDK